MRSSILVGIGALLLGLSSTASHRAAAPGKSPAKPLLAFVWDGSQYRLGHVSPTTLRALPGRRLAVGNGPEAWTFSPGRTRLALAGRDEIRLVDPGRMRVAARVPGTWDATTGLVWATPSRVLVVNGRLPAVQAVANGRIVWTRALDGTLNDWTAIPGGIALLLSPESGIGTTTVATVTAGGVVRTAVLDRVRTGSIWPEDGSSLATVSFAGFTVDPATNRAYVIPTGTTAAEVDLSTMAVSYHALSQPVSLLGRLHGWLEPRAEAKGANGPWRRARMLGDHLIAVTGDDEAAWLDAGGEVFTSTPSGLRLIDTRTWSVRTLDATTSWIDGAGGLLAASGSSWDSRAKTATGRGLDVYGPDGSRLYHLFGTDAVNGVQSANGLAYAWASGFTVFDLATGEVVARPALSANYPPQLLIP